VTFLAFGVLLTLIRLRNAPIGTLANRWRRPVAAAFALQLILCVPLGLWQLHDVWVKGNTGRWGPPVATCFGCRRGSCVADGRSFLLGDSLE